MKLFFFSCGILESTTDLFINGQGKDSFLAPVPFFLIQHNGKNIMFDTGNHPDDMIGHLLSRLTDNVNPIFSEADLAHNAIRKVGLTPEDIDIIILSHLHHDHAGEITFFPNATIIVQKDEFDYIRRPDYFMTQAYYNDEAPANVTNFYMDGKDVLKKPQIDWFFIDGNIDKSFDLFGDGRIVIVFTPGHTIGHQSLLVTTDDGTRFLLAADACYTEANLRSNTLPGLVADSHAYMNNLSYFRLLEKTGAKIVYGHDPQSWSQFNLAPEYY